MSYDNLSDFLDGQRYDTERDGYLDDGYTEKNAPKVTANAQVSTLRRGLESVTANAQVSTLRTGLGDFTPTQLCFARPMAQLAWAFLATAAEGRSMDALGVLSVYRSLFNSQRAAILSGLPATVQSALPASLPEVAWTDPMRISVALILGSVAGTSGDRRTALASIPNSIGAIPAWFSGARASFDETTLRAYLEVPRVGGETLAAAILRAVQDDVDLCLNPPAPAPVRATVVSTPQTPTYTARPIYYDERRTAVTTTPTPASGGGNENRNPTPPTTTSNGSGLLIGILAVLAAGAYWVYRTETKKTPTRVEE